jgi:hypothetical protein
VKRSDAAVKAGFALLQRLWCSQDEAGWAALAHPWPQQLQGLAAALRARLQQRALDLVGRAYVDLAPARLAALTGQSEAEAVQGGRLPCGGRAAPNRALATRMPPLAGVTPVVIDR